MPSVRTDRGLDRLVTFLDAVVAIAITLLVLPLIDLLAGAEAAQDVGALLGDHLAQFGSFALSFVVIARLWVAHHALTERVGAYDGLFLLVNLSWAFTVVVLPFVTQVTAVYGSERLAVGMYVGTVTASSACVSVLSVLVRRRAALRREGVAAGDVRLEASVATTGLLVVALVLGVAFPAVNYYAFFLLFLDRPAVRLLRRRVPR
ncbi:MAG: conserved rane protein of unknown function [Modestobacter sp.]|nr:conserved rane protein of unknown function [Modestobacter sp.]